MLGQRIGYIRVSRGKPRIRVKIYHSALLF
jgi:hypothetical protein